MENELLPKRVDDAVRSVVLWVGRLVSDWSIVKREIMSELADEDRRLFSRRHQITKEVDLNPFEERVIVRWKELTGIRLEVTTRDERRELRWWDPTMVYDRRMITREHGRTWGTLTGQKQGMTAADVRAKEEARRSYEDGLRERWSFDVADGEDPSDERF